MKNIARPVETYRVSLEPGAWREVEAKAKKSERHKAQNARRRVWASLGALFLAFSVAGCAQPSPTVITGSRPSASLPADRLVKYNDTFDQLRGDLYETLTSPGKKENLANLKIADVAIEDGQLVIRTKTGCFSGAGLVTRYRLRGDFDIQIDCHMDFLKQVDDMDQMLYLAILAGRKDRYDLDNRVVIGVGKFSNGPSGVACYSADGGRANRGNTRKIADFHGALRAVRKGNKVTVFCRNGGERKWFELDSFSFTATDAGFGFVVSNFVPRRTTIKASASITGRFDNLTINAAQEIVESEI